jgi:hypothetical protein
MMDAVKRVTRLLTAGMAFVRLHCGVASAFAPRSCPNHRDENTFVKLLCLSILALLNRLVVVGVGYRVARNFECGLRARVLERLNGGGSLPPSNPATLTPASERLMMGGAGDTRSRGQSEEAGSYSTDELGGAPASSASAYSSVPVRVTRVTVASGSSADPIPASTSCSSATPTSSAAPAVVSHPHSTEQAAAASSSDAPLVVVVAPTHAALDDPPAPQPHSTSSRVTRGVAPASAAAAGSGLSALDEAIGAGYDYDSDSERTPAQGKSVLHDRD